MFPISKSLLLFFLITTQNIANKVPTPILLLKKCVVYVIKNHLVLFWTIFRSENGKLFVKYEVIGNNHVAVPTHFFKVLVIEDNNGQFELQSYMMPNQPIPNGIPLKNYFYPVDAIERAAGFLLFEKIPKKTFKVINGKKYS